MNSPATGFLSLPLEIRLEIYHLLLHLPPYFRYELHPSTVHPQLLLANRQINHEATPLLYSDNTFLAHPSLLSSFPRLREWYAPVRELTVVPRIRRFHIQVRLDCDVPYAREAVAAAFSGLEELSVDVIQSVFLGVGHANLTHFEAIRGVSRAKISGSTTGFEDYVVWLQAAMQSHSSSDVVPFKPAPNTTALRLNIVH